MGGNDHNSENVGRDTPYQPLLGSVSDSFHAGMTAPDDDDDVPPATFLQMGDLHEGHYRGGGLLVSNGAMGMAWPTSKRKLDKFLTRVYRYYVGKGLATIVLANLFNLFILGFIVVFTTFLAGCIDYSVLMTTYDFYAAVNIAFLKDLNPFIIISLVVFALFWLWRVFHVIWDIRHLLQAHKFYQNKLQISDSDLPTTRWTDVVTKLLDVQDEDDESKRLNHHDVANIIMRRENYLVAMFNMDVIRIDLPIPFLGNVLTKSLEWNIDRCLMDYIFDDTSIRKNFLNPTEPVESLARTLRWRLRLWALANLIFLPFIVIFLVMYFVFQYGEEVHRDPGSLGARQYTPYAKIIFREFNEYPHLFERRINASFDKAREYMNLFPYEKLALLARFVSFVSGAFAFVLVVLSFVDEDLLLKAEIVPGHNVLWFLGVFSAIYAGARSFIPAETVVFQPERLMRTVIEGTHYYPPEWHKNLHSDLVHRQFSRLFEYKAAIYLTEIFGVILVPFILAFSLPACAEDIVEFVVKNTEYREKIGHVCSYALFDLSKRGDPMYGAPTSATDKKAASRFGKMEKSFLNFKANNPAWQPGPDGTQFLENLRKFHGLHGRQVPLEASIPAEDLAESSLFVSSVVLSSALSAPADVRTSGKGKEKATLGESTMSARSDGGVRTSRVNNVMDSVMSMRLSALDDEGMMSLLEDVYSAHEGGMV